MSLIAKDTGGGKDFPRVPAGTHIARCVQVIDQGTQYIESKMYGSSWQPKVLLGFEFPEELQPNDNGVQEPLLLWKQFTNTLNDKGNLCKELQRWRGQAFTEAERRGFDLSTVVGVPAMVSVEEYEYNGKMYSGISGIAAIPKSTECPKQVHKSIVFTLDDFDHDVFATFSPFHQEKIRASKEWQAMFGDASPGGVTQPSDSDDIPF